MNYRQKELSSQIDHQQSITKAEQFLVNNISDIGLFERLLLDYIQRTYGQSSTLGISSVSLEEFEDRPTEELKYLQRIVHPKQIISSPPSGSLHPISKMNIYSANCDHLPLYDAFWDDLAQSNQAGGYMTTHVGLSLVFMRNNGCELPAQLSGFPYEVYENLAAIFSDETNSLDLRHEAVLMLLLNGQRDRVPSEWIDEIALAQLENGGWPEESGNSDPSYHSSTLAYWTLLGYFNPDKVSQPLIR